jgi:hypothetical protein
MATNVDLSKKSSIHHGVSLDRRLTRLVGQQRNLSKEVSLLQRKHVLQVSSFQIAGVPLHLFFWSSQEQV